MRKSKATAANDTVLNPVTNPVHPLDQQTNDDLLDAYITATARFVKGMGFGPNEWSLVQIWARKTKHGTVSNDIRVSVNGEYIGETERPDTK